MANWIYDERTEHSRLMVGYDRYGLYVKEWSEAHEESELPFNFREAMFNWNQVKTRERCYSGDDGSGRVKARMVAAGISLMCYWGGDSDTEGDVSTLDARLDCYGKEYTI